MTTNHAMLDATAQAELVRTGQATPLELVDEAILRIEKLNPQLNAVITPLFEKARQQAQASDLPNGPFRGVPFLLKDLVCHSAGDPYHCGTKFLKELNYIAPTDTYLAAKFREAGFINLGKTNTPEFGSTVTTEPEAYGASCNPWNLKHSTGGSSGGAAAAVASGMVPVAHANDGGGSIRVPASECGLVGLKPCRGRVSAGPEAGEGWAGATIEGVVSRSVRDSAAVLDAISAPVPGDPYFAPPPAKPFSTFVGDAPSSLKIGLFTGAPYLEAHADCTAAVQHTAQLLESLGHQVEESHPTAIGDPDFSTHFVNILGVATVADIDAWAEKIGRPITEEDIEMSNWNFYQLGKTINGSDYLKSVNWIHAFTRRMAAWWADDGFDLLLTPTIAAPPPELGWLSDPSAGTERVLSLIPFTPPFNSTGQPAISLPLFWNEAGLPIGIQLVGAYAREDLLIQIASQLEIAQPWAEKWPAVSAINL
ncbi:MAG: amidase family protein [Pseudomonadota bacterium]